MQPNKPLKQLGQYQKPHGRTLELMAKTNKHNMQQAMSQSKVKKIG